MQASQYKEIFSENVVMTMEHLKLKTGQPRESILRDLKSVGYYSSYNERGKFYTLDGTPVFDNNGLWKYRSAYFSIRRTLIDTAAYLVSASNAGYTHDELRQILGIGVQNTLHQLTMEGRVARQKVGDQYVYFGKDNIHRQMEKRIAMPVVPIVRRTARIPEGRVCPGIDPVVVIDVLIAVLRGHGTDDAAYSYLHQTGSQVTAQQVAEIFRYYDIGKKNSPIQK